VVGKGFSGARQGARQRQGLTITAVLQRANLTEDYFRHPPEMGRNIGGIFKIADVLQVNPAELMALDIPSDERRSMTMIAHVMAHVHLTVMRANGNGNGAGPDIEQIVVAVMEALKQYEAPPATAKRRTKAAAPRKTKPAV
jgi:hypothetical protein